MDIPHSRQFATSPRSLIAGLALLCLTTGCATPWERSLLLKDSTPSIDRVKGPQERALTNFFKKKQEEAPDDTVGSSLKPIAGTDEYLAAVDLLKQEKYEEARKAFKKVAKTFKKSEIREDALFMQAEAAWKQDHYATAHDAYAVLLKEYPSTRHLNVVSERLFKIGRLWLDFPEVATLEEIQQVNFDEPSKPLPSKEPAKTPKSKKPIFVPNFRNKQEPLFDTPGNGCAALTAVWMNDPVGPLADDAMMLVASYYARTGNYVEADRHFQNLRELYPQSPHVQNAFLLGSHVKLMSYQGPEYETRTLYEAQLLKESTMKLYPGVEDARLKDELARIEQAKAEVIWRQVLFYQKKNQKRACAIYCHDLIAQFPKSAFAEKAKAKLVELGPEYQSGAIFLTKDEPDNRSVVEKILEPKWMNNPPQLIPRRKKSPKTASKPATPSKPAKETNPTDDESVKDDEVPPSTDEPPVKSPKQPRRLPDSDQQQNDDDADDGPSHPAPARQASFR